MFEPSLKDMLTLTFVEGVRSKTLNTCSRWAEHRRIMGSPFEGPYSFKYFPWTRAIHDCQAQYTIAMKSAQAGVTEVGINRAFYVLDQLKRDVLYVKWRTHRVICEVKQSYMLETPGIHQY